jgi:hypothetical protein
MQYTLYIVFLSNYGCCPANSMNLFQLLLPLKLPLAPQPPKNHPKKQSEQQQKCIISIFSINRISRSKWGEGKRYHPGSRAISTEL